MPLVGTSLASATTPAALADTVACSLPPQQAMPSRPLGPGGPVWAYRYRQPRGRAYRYRCRYRCRPPRAYR